MTRIFIVKETEERVLTASPEGLFAYEVTNLNNMSWDVNTPVSPMPLPEESHKENILVKMEGNSAQMSVSWTLLADDVTHFGTFDSTLSNASNRFIADTDSRNVFKEMEVFKEDYIPENIQDAYSIWFMSDDLGTITGNFIKHYPKGSEVQLLLQPEDLEHDDKSNLKLEVVDRRFRGTNFIYTLKTESNKLIPVFVHSHHIHQHEVDEKFGIKRPINIDHIVCF